jgi:hypothetical protein
VCARPNDPFGEVEDDSLSAFTFFAESYIFLKKGKVYHYLFAIHIEIVYFLWKAGR